MLIILKNVNFISLEQCLGTNIGEIQKEISIETEKIRTTDVNNGGETFVTGMVVV